METIPIEKYFLGNVFSKPIHNFPKQKCFQRQELGFSEFHVRLGCATGASRGGTCGILIIFVLLPNYKFIPWTSSKKRGTNRVSEVHKQVSALLMRFNFIPF